MLKLKNPRLNPYTFALIVIFAISAYLKWRFFYGLVMSDDFSYGVYAYRLFREPLPWDMNMDFRTLRFSLLLPVAVLYRIVSPSEFVTVLYPIVASFGTILMVYLIGKKLVGPNAGIFAAFIYATFPTDIRAGTLLLPGIIVTFFLSLAVLLFIHADLESGKKSRIFYFFTGLAIFIAFNARENSYYFLPFVFNKKRWENGMYMIGAGFVLPVLLLYTFYYFKTGDFLYNLHLAQKYRDPLIASGYIPKNSTNWYMCFYYMFPEFFSAFRGGRGYINPIFGINFVLGVPFLLYVTVKSLVKRNWKLLIIPWWFLLAYLYQEFGTISFESYQMMRKLSRFLLLLTPALAIGYGVIFSDIAQVVSERIKKYKRLTLLHIPTVSIIGILIILHLFSLMFVLIISKNNTRYSIRKYRWVYYRVLSEKPNKPVYHTGGWWNNKLAYYYLPDIRYADVSWDRSTMLRDLKNVKNPTELRGSYVIVDRSHFNSENDLNLLLSYDDYGSYLQFPSDEWEFLGSAYNVEIYEVPNGWVYVEPDEQEIALNAFIHALKVKDLMLAIQNLHPDFLSGFSGEQFRAFIDSIIDLNSPLSKQIFSEKVRYKMYNGKWKLLFLLD
ncbi:ArnT family glycosyltransferase [Candidatus Latescibacterota bacterium]